MRFGPAIKAFVLCLLISTCGIGYVWQKTQIVELGKQRKQQEIRLLGLEQQNEKLKGLLADMRKVSSLERKIKELGLVEPQPSQIWWLVEPARDGAPRPGSQLALQEAPRTR